MRKNEEKKEIEARNANKYIRYCSVKKSAHDEILM